MLQTSDAAWISCWQPNVNGKVKEATNSEKVKVAPTSKDATFNQKVFYLEFSARMGFKLNVYTQTQKNVTSDLRL